MSCPQCQTVEVKVSNEIGDSGDIERTICANGDCNTILKEEILVERSDGTKYRRSRSIKIEDQPESFQFANKNGGTSAVIDDLLSADQMLQLAIDTREVTIGKEAREIAKIILTSCAKVVLDGEYTYLIGEEDAPSGAIIIQVIKELTGRGYQAKRIPIPGKGTEVQVKWPTKQKTKRKKKQSQKDAMVAPQTQQTNKGQNKGTIQRQRQAVLTRKKALKER